MKKLLIALTLLLSICSFCQKKQIQKNPNITVTYSFETLKGLFKNDVELKIKDNITQFLVDIKASEKKEYRGGEVEQMADYHITNYNISNNTFTAQRKLNKKLLKSEWINDFKWKITDETKIIGGYKVTKATTESYEIKKGDGFYYGNAIAWFTTEIPISSGPGRYAGLPGLILEIEYDKGGSVYKFKNIDFAKIVVLKSIESGTTTSKDNLLYSY